MPFRHVKKLLRKEEPQEPMRKPILDTTPKQVSADVYNLPTLDDLPELPQPANDIYGKPPSALEEESDYTLHPDIPVSQKQWQAPSEVTSYQQVRQPQPQPRPIQTEDARDVMRKYDDSDPSRVIEFLERIEKRMIDIDRRLALIERGMR